MKHQPSRLAKNILRRFCHVSFIEEVEGDLDEQFYGNVETKGLFRAHVGYWIDVLQAVMWGNNKERTHSIGGASPLDTMRHFFKIFFRSMRHSRTSAIINITGLVLSLMSFIVIWLYVNDELTYDSFHPDAEHTYRVSHSYKRYGDGVPEADSRIPGMWIQVVRESIPDIKASTRFSRFGFPGSVKYEKKDILNEEGAFFWVDTTYTDIFSVVITKGADPKVIFSDPSKVLINETTAQKYFGNDDPIGQDIIYSRQGMDFNFVVAGVMKDYPSNAHFHPAFLAGSMALDPLWKRNNYDRINSFDDAFTYTFIKVDDDSSLSKIAAAFTPVAQKSYNDTVQPVFTKLTDIHFTQGMLVELEAPGDRLYSYISASIGILILIVAAINYMNLATARSVRRSKEVGLRKTLGVRRSSLISQFLGESAVMMLISFVIAIAAAIALLPFFNELTGKSFTYLSLLSGNTLIILMATIGGLSMLSGSYPAFYLSRFKPAEVLKGNVTTGSRAENFRKILVVFQFTITMGLIVSAAVIRNQISFIQVGKLAGNTGHVITIRNVAVGTVKEPDLLRGMVMQNKNIESMSMSDHLPRRDGFGFITMALKFGSKGDENYMWDVLKADSHFAEMFKLELVAGRNFSPGITPDTVNCILNESAVRALNMTPEEVVGQKIDVDPDYFPVKFGKVIGVVKDFPYESIRLRISPMVLFGYYPAAETINIKLTGTDMSATIADIEKAWKKLHPARPFEYWFMDQEFGKLYKQEMQMATLSNYFTLFTIVIACLGLFGLAAFTTEQKTKEIGIRKVLGASVGQILLLLTNRFVRLVLLACAAAIPLSFYAMNVWLGGFAYRAPMQWWVFVGAGVLILLLTYITVGIESVRAAIRNPVDSIRHE